MCQMRLHRPLQVVNRDVSIAMLRYFGKEREKEKAAGAKSYKRVKGGVMPAALSAGLEEVRVGHAAACPGECIGTSLHKNRNVPV